MTDTAGPITTDAFRDEALAFLNANAKLREAEQKFVWGEGDDSVALLEETEPEVERRQVAAAKEWRAKKYDAGFGWITGFPEYGGRGLSREHERIWTSLEARYDIADQSPFAIGLGMIAPTVLAHARDDVRQEYLPQLYRGDIIACQLFSEPGAGSDLASLQTRAERDGDEWMITGQKVWTSGAQFSDIGEIVCRSDPDQPKHKGITAFLIDMGAPGVDIRPLRQMTGGATFNEVFFNEARVADRFRLGDVNEGWSVALTTLMNERASIGAGGGGAGQLGLADATRLAEMVRHFGLANDPVVRQELAAIYTDFQVAKFTNRRAMDKIKAGQAPGPELTIAKLSLTQNLTAVTEFVGRVLGPRLTADTGEWGTYSWAKFLLGVPAMHIAGGSDEILRNIVGERVLGLPKEPGIDTTSPFKDLRKS